MVAYSFKARFAAPILAGTKAQTIRAHGKRRHAQAGDRLDLYTGMRTRSCRLIARTPCRETVDVVLDFVNRRVTLNPESRAGRITMYEPAELDAFAGWDGFADWKEMAAFWREEHPASNGFFEGVLVRWYPLAPASELDIGAVA